MNLCIRPINKTDAKPLLDKYHYLSKISSTFRISPTSYGAFTPSGNLVGVCIFTNFPAPELFKSIWGFDKFREMNQRGFFELSRLCLDPEMQVRTSNGHASNVASWFVSRSIRKLKTDCKVKYGENCKAVLSYADSDYHSGIVYAASNFDYYGLSNIKYDIWVPCPPDCGGKWLEPQKRLGRSETHWKKMSRGWRQHLDNGGIKIQRGRKHRFLMVFDKTLPEVKWCKQIWRSA